MLIGYARVSTKDQNLHAQLDGLSDAGCEKVFSDKISSSKAERLQLLAALDYMREGDTLVVMKLDRLGRSLKELVSIVENLHERKMHFKTLDGYQFDTSSAGGKLTFQLFAALAEFERNVIRERTQAGLAAAVVRGQKGGRPSKITDANRYQIRALLADPDTTISQICETMGISRGTLYKHFPMGKRS